MAQCLVYYGGTIVVCDSLTLEEDLRILEKEIIEPPFFIWFVYERPPLLVDAIYF